MKKEIRTVDEQKKIVQITTVDERWYAMPETDKVTGLPSYKFVPSVTWICEHYPKGIAYYKWLANKGWDEAEALKEAAGDKGSKVHQAVALLIDGNSITMESAFVNNRTNNLEPLTLEEYECILSFADWFKEAKPKIKVREFVVINEQENYAGTVDLLCEIGDKLYIVDLKTSQYIWPSHELQVSAYKHAKMNEATSFTDEISLAILQLGYRLNKRRFKFTEIKDKFVEFLAAKVIWANETNGDKPLQRDYPLEIKL
jgi:hypothetical protein